MPLILAALVAASPLFYQAKVPSFGCTSNDEVAKLQQMRSDQKAFQSELMQEIFYGECVEITKGQFVEGAVEAAHPSMLVVDRRILPPGYIAPIGDFELKPKGESIKKKS